MMPGPQRGRGSNGDERSFGDKVIATWVLVPDWVEELAKEADARGLKGAAKKLNCSPSLVSNVLANKYPGDLIRIEEVVRGALMGSTVWCQGVGGDMTRDVCLEWQRKPRVATSGHAMRMYRACRDSCPHFRPHTKGDAAAVAASEQAAAR